MDSLPTADNSTTAGGVLPQSAAHVVPPQSKALQSTAADEAPIYEDEEQAAAAETRRRWFDWQAHREGVREAAPTLISAGVHFLALLALALLLGDRPPKYVRPPPQIEVVDAPEIETVDPLSFELEEQLVHLDFRPETTHSASVASGDVGTGVVLGGEGGDVGASAGNGLPAGVSAPALDAGLLAQAGAGLGALNIESPLSMLPPSTQLAAEAPEGLMGQARAVVGGYQEALDRMTQEVLWMLDDGPVLIVWAFDESESMKDDQTDIRNRIEHIYEQLGLVGSGTDDALETAVVSYGAGYVQHTRRPTADLNEIRRAIAEVPVDPSGKEMMCSAVLQAIGTHRNYARKTHRQMALVLITDESGDRADNDAQLERAIAEAKAARTKIFVLGREAVFGYPYAQFRWTHPQTKDVHWLPIDRGPESAFVEQLQTDGFHRRHDSHPSGAGPYECVRLARETGGIFFMLPTLESDLIDGVKFKYNVTAMERYLPDLRSRLEVADDREKSKLQTVLTKVIYDLNPYDPKTAELIEMRVHFSPDPEAFLRQAREERDKAVVYLTYLERAEKEVAKLQDLRRYETAPRWQANYDLLAAQLIAYEARMYEYGAYLEEFARDPKKVPLKKGEQRLTGWRIVGRQRTITGSKVQPLIERATKMFKQIQVDHAGTPWAARAGLELDRGFGVELVEVYNAPGGAANLAPGTKLLAIPKL